MPPVTFEQYLRFWLEHGNKTFVLIAEETPDGLRFDIAPQLSINANSTFGIWTFDMTDNNPTRTGNYV
jgi:hypothetical protein